MDITYHQPLQLTTANQTNLCKLYNISFLLYVAKKKDIAVFTVLIGRHQFHLYQYLNYHRSSREKPFTGTRIRIEEPPYFSAEKIQTPLFYQNWREKNHTQKNNN